MRQPAKRMVGDGCSCSRVACQSFDQYLLEHFAQTGEKGDGARVVGDGGVGASRFEDRDAFRDSPGREQLPIVQ